MIAVDVTTLGDPFSQLDDAGRALVRTYIREHLRKVREDPLTYGHPPHEVQERIHGSLSKALCVVAANRLGKSEGGMREVLWRAIGDHPYKKLRPHSTIWVGCPSYPFFLETTWVHFERWCPKKYLISYNEGTKIAKIRRKDGGICRIHFKTYDQGRRKWQGAGVDFVWLDEQCPEDIYNEAFARIITTNGDILLTFTPVEGVLWEWDRILEPHLKGKGSFEVIEGALAEYSETAEFNVGRVLVPHLSRAAVLRFAEQYPDPDERAIRVFGQIRKRSGAVYKGFDEAIHVVPAFRVPDHWHLWGAVDPGYHGWAATIYAMSPAGQVYVVAELFSQEEVTRTRFTALRDLLLTVRTEEAMGEAVVFFVDTEDPQTVLELNVQAVEAEAPFAFASLDQGLKARMAGMLRIQQLLAPSPKRSTPIEVARPRSAAGEPILYFFDSLASVWRSGETQIAESRLLWEMKRYLWKKPKKGSTVKVDDADEESADGAHALATLRYGIMARFGAPDAPKEDPTEAAGEDAWVWQDLLQLEEEMQLQAGTYEP